MTPTPRDDWTVHYQPIVDLGTGRIVAAEALIRPARSGLVRPGWMGSRVIELETGSSPLGLAVMDVALRATKDWPIEVAVNVAPALLDARLLGLLATSQERAGPICLEVTERTPVDAAGRLVLERAVDELDVRVSLDDFGTGVRTCADLRDLPVHELKVDQRFVAGLGVHEADLAIVTHLIDLAHALGLIVVAEGVETDTQARLLADLGCDRGQGWLWSPAVCADQLPSSLASRPRSALCR